MTDKTLPQTKSRRAREQAGREAEETAARYLLGCGYDVVRRRYRPARALGSGEIDLIVTRGSLLVFVEVKARKSVEEGLYAITPRQQARMASAANSFLAENAAFSGYDIRFDAVMVVPGAFPVHIEHILLQG